MFQTVDPMSLKYPSTSQSTNDPFAWVGEHLFNIRWGEGLGPGSGGASRGARLGGERGGALVVSAGISCRPVHPPRPRALH